MLINYNEEYKSLNAPYGARCFLTIRIACLVTQ